MREAARLRGFITDAQTWQCVCVPADWPRSDQRSALLLLHQVSSSQNVHGAIAAEAQAVTDQSAAAETRPRGHCELLKHFRNRI